MSLGMDQKQFFFYNSLTAVYLWKWISFYRVSIWGYLRPK